MGVINNYGVFQLTCTSFLLVCMLMISTAPDHVNAVITCRDVYGKLGSCNNYLMMGGSTPRSGCCTGVKSLKAAAKTGADRQAICRCLKDAYKKHSTSINIGKAQNLPKVCGVSTVPNTISLGTNCDKVQ
uniref:Non-specific lipid-transfer protein n=1 Tax=Davidia involucrata TaxID=16924 RepID=A0A5B7BAY4_DAVIN